MNPTKRSTVIDAYMAMSRLSKYCRKPKLAHALAMNIKRSEDEAKAFDKAREPDSTQKAFEAKRMELVKEHAKELDAEGNPVSKPSADGLGTTIELKDPIAYKAAYDALAAEHQDVLDAQLAKQVEIQAMLDESVAIAWFHADVEWALDDNSWDLEAMRADKVNLTALLFVLNDTIFAKPEEAPAAKA